MFSFEFCYSSCDWQFGKLMGMTMTLSLQRILERTPCHLKENWNSKYNQANRNSKNHKGMRETEECCSATQPVGNSQPAPPAPCTKHSVPESKGLSVPFFRYTLQVCGETASWTGVEHHLSSLIEKLYRNVIRMRLLESSNDHQIKVLS